MDIPPEDVDKINLENSNSFDKDDPDTIMLGLS